MVVDYSITVGNIIEIMSIVGGGFTVLVSLKNRVATLKDDVGDIQRELKKLADIMISMARFEEKITNLDKRVTSHGRQIEEMRRGEGFIRGQRRHGIDGEYAEEIP